MIPTIQAASLRILRHRGDNVPEMLDHEAILGESLLQGGWGVDHLVVATRNLHSSTTDYRALGFAVMPGGRHPRGTENSTARFENGTYLELLSLYDPSKDEALSSFLEKHEGGISVGLNTGKAEGSASYLKSHGVETRVGDGTISFEDTPVPPPVFWRWVEIREGTAASDTIFLIEYTQARVAYQMDHPEHYGNTKHPNTAKRLASVWIAVRDVSEAVKRYERLGLTMTRSAEFPQMSANGAVLQAGQGWVQLLSPVESKGPILRFLSQRGEGVVGASIEVTDLDACTGILEGSRIQHEKYRGIHGDSIMVKPEHSHGLCLEMFE